MAGLYSCQSPNGGGGGDFLYTIHLDEAEKVDSPSISEFCDEAKTIILETTENSLLSGMTLTLSCTNDRLYVFDDNVRTGGSVSEFGMDGQFIKRYGRIGRGPGEYSTLSNFAIDQLNGLMYLIDFRTKRLMSYDLDSGQYIETMRIDQNETITTTIVPVGDLIYSDLNYGDFDESNYMLKSWNRVDPAIENYYLPVGKHLKGWSNISIMGHSKFIYRSGNDYALFSDRYSPEIFKLTPEGIENYIYIESKDFINAKDRQAVSARHNGNTNPATSPGLPSDILSELDCFYGISHYLETERYIDFGILRGNSIMMFTHDKHNGTTQNNTRYSSGIDLIVKKEHPEAQSLFQVLPADNEGMYFFTPSRMIPRLRTAAQEGMLVDDLDRLEELKQLPDDSNPVIFYMKFKEPMQ